MNDVGYETAIKFEDSISYNTLKFASAETLLHLKPYYEGAIEYHTKENNISQIEYFSIGLDLLNKRLKRFEKKGQSSIADAKNQGVIP